MANQIGSDPPDGYHQAMKTLAEVEVDPRWRPTAMAIPVGDVLGGDVIDLPGRIPVLLLGDGGRVVLDVSDPRQSTHDVACALVESLAAAAARRQCRPGQLDAVTRELASALRRMLEPSGILVTHDPRPGVLDVREDLRAYVEGLITLGPHGCVVTDAGALDAAMAFHEAAPWRWVTCLEPLLLETELPGLQWPVAVMAGKTATRPMWFFPSAEDHWASITDDVAPQSAVGVWRLGFHTIHEMTLAQRAIVHCGRFPRTADGRVPIIQWEHPLRWSKDDGTPMPDPTVVAPGSRRSSRH